MCYLIGIDFVGLFGNNINRDMWNKAELNKGYFTFI